MKSDLLPILTYVRLLPSVLHHLFLFSVCEKDMTLTARYGHILLKHVTVVNKRRLKFSNVQNQLKQLEQISNCA